MEKLWLFDKNEPFCWARGYRNFKAPLPMRRSVEVLPGVYSFDDVFLKFLGKLADELNAHPKLQVSLDDNMMTGDNGVHTSFSRMKTVAGYASSPLSYPSVDNSLACDELGLPSGFRSARHQDIFDELCDLIFGNWKPTAIKVPKHSTLGPPMMFVYDAVYKRDIAVYIYENIDEILDLFNKRDFEGLADKYGIWFLYNLNRRGQVDEPGKVRESNTLEYALSGGRSGATVNTDKSIRFDDGRSYADFSATRERIVQGASWTINCILQVLASGHMYAMFESFPETFHMTDPNDIAEACVREGDATFSDVTSFDATMREYMLRRMFDRARQFWRTDLIDMAELLYFSPYYARPLDINGGQRGVLVGNPMDPFSTPISAGNRSGHAWTSLTNKLIKVFDSLTVIDDAFGDVLGNVKNYLKWKNPIKLANNGDDEGAIGSPRAIEVYRSMRYNGKHGYFKVDPEKGQAFSGSLMIWKGKLAGLAVPRLPSIFEKMYVPERSIGGKFRPRWPIGFITRLEALSNHPSGGYADEIHRKLWHDICAPVYGKFSELLSQGMAGLDVQLDGLSRIEKEVLEDHSKIHHKYIGMEKEISDAVWDKIAVKIQPSEFEWAITMYKGNIT